MALLDKLRSTGGSPRPPQRQAPATTSSLPPGHDLPYAGLLAVDQPTDPDSLNANQGRKRGQIAISAPHTLVCAKTGGGKTRGVLGHNIIMWGPRPVIALSSKGDLAELTIEKRARRGPVYLMDLSQEVRPDELKGVDVTHVVCDPCELVFDDDSAMQVASLLHQVGSLGAGGTGEASDESAQWKSLATRPLAAFLRAGGWLVDPVTEEPFWGGGILWVLDAIDQMNKEPDAEEDDFESPNWDVAILRAETMLESRHARTLTAAKEMDPKQRDSIAINLRMALTAWSLEAVTGDGNGTRFHPAMLEEPGATLFVVGPQKHPAAAAATLVLSQAVVHWRKRVGQLPDLMFVLDELANGAPWPNLATVITEARSIGCRVVAACQSTKQFKTNWGVVGAEDLMEAWPSVLILPGAAEKELLEQAAWWAGEAERSTSSTDSLGRASLSHDRAETITASDLLPRRKGQGRLLINGQPGVLVDLPDISQTTLLD